MSTQAVTMARIDIVTPDNATWTDAFQFGIVGDTSWSFTSQNFRLDIKGNKFTQTAALLSLTSGAGQILVQDAVQRILQMNVPEATLTGALVPGEYQYDLIMFDGSVPPVRIPLMYGQFKLVHGVTGG
jgi:hypothetical protein